MIDTDEITIFLSGIRIFQHLDYDIIEDIAHNILCESINQGDYLIRQGDLGAKMHIIWSGDVIVKVSSERNNALKEIGLRKGAILGEISMLSDSAYSANVIAKSDVIALIIEKPTFHKLIKKHLTFADALSELMANRLIENDGIRQVGKYRILGKIGEGGMAIVYNAFDTDLEREVAIKMLKYQIASHPEILAGFYQEAKTIAAIKHPNIVNVVEVVKEFSTSFIVMEKAEGMDLRQYLGMYSAFRPIQARKIIGALAKALEYAHNQGIIHRDIKPSNVIMDPQQNIKLMDFGIAGPPSSTDSMIVGTPLYMSPEMIQGQAVDGKTDIYALGIMAYQLLVGKTPFNHSDYRVIWKKHINETPPLIEEQVEGVPAGFASFINAALIKDPKARISDWQTIHNLLNPETTIAADEQCELSMAEYGIFIKIKTESATDKSDILASIDNMLVHKQVDFSIKTIVPTHDVSAVKTFVGTDVSGDITSELTRIDL